MLRNVAVKADPKREIVRNHDQQDMYPDNQDPTVLHDNGFDHEFSLQLASTAAFGRIGL
jgi:hypothetical protein